MLTLEYATRPPRSVVRVRVGEGVLVSLVEELVADFGERRFVVVTDDTVLPLHAEPLARRLRARGLSVELLAFPAGEPSKSAEVKADLESRMFRLGLGGDTLLIAVGGGVTGDLGGYIAATWHRGIPLIQVPTSLLAMVDASVGGKNGINLPGGKNLVGTIHQPLSIHSDVSVLETLPDGVLRDGFAEVIKSATIADSGFFRWLEKNVEPLLAREGEALEQAIARCVTIKSRVVSRDVLDRGRRAILNFGHTVAHAIESVSDYDESHGRAVATGMCIEGQLACEATGFPPGHLDRLRTLVTRFGLPAAPRPEWNVDELVRASKRDKKSRDGKARFAPPRRLGRMIPGAEVTVEIDDSRLRRALLWQN